jgi:hypothetical protein
VGLIIASLKLPVGGRTFVDGLRLPARNEDLFAGVPARR